MDEGQPHLADQRRLAEGELIRGVTANRGGDGEILDLQVEFGVWQWREQNLDAGGSSAGNASATVSPFVVMVIKRIETDVQADLVQRAKQGAVSDNSKTNIVGGEGLHTIWRCISDDVAVIDDVALYEYGWVVVGLFVTVGRLVGTNVEDKVSRTKLGERAREGISGVSQGRGQSRKICKGTAMLPDVADCGRSAGVFGYPTQPDPVAVPVGGFAASRPRVDRYRDSPARSSKTDSYRQFHETLHLRSRSPSLP